MAKLRLKPEAEKDLEGIWRYTEENWGIDQAEYYVDALIETFYLLSENPLMCHERTELTPSVRIHHHAHHLIVFVLVSEDIEIVRVLHESMDFESQFPNVPV